MHLFKISYYLCFMCRQSESLTIFPLMSFSCFSFLSLVIFSDLGLWTVPLRLHWPLPSSYIFFFWEILCYEYSMLTVCQPFLILRIEYILPYSPGFYYFGISSLKSSCFTLLSQDKISKYLLFKHKAKSLNKRLPVSIWVPTILIMDWHTIKLPETHNQYDFSERSFTIYTSIVMLTIWWWSMLRIHFSWRHPQNRQQ